MRRMWLLLTMGAVTLGCTRTTELIAAASSKPAECIAPGPVVRLGGTEDSACAGALAARLGRYALCTCTNLNLTGDLSVKGPRALGGTSGISGGIGGMGGTIGITGMGGMAPGPGGPPAPTFLTAVGTDGNAHIAGVFDVSGSFVAAGTGDVAFSRGAVRGNLHAAGNLITFTRMGFFVDGDAYVGGDVSGPFAIGGTLHVPSTSTVAPQTQAESVIQEDVSVTEPCGCGAGPVFDFASTIASRAMANANASLLFPGALLADITTPQTLDWPCGEYYLTEIRAGADAALEFRVHGHVGIFVAGDVRLGNNLQVTLDPGAELDLVVGGSFFMTGRVFGSPAQPTGTRLWVGSTTVSLPDQVQFGAAVYAPTAVFSAGVGMTFSGTLFVDTLSVAGDVRITYDPAATRAGQSCGVDPPPPVE